MAAWICFLIFMLGICVHLSKKADMFQVWIMYFSLGKTNHACYGSGVTLGKSLNPILDSANPAVCGYLMQ